MSVYRLTDQVSLRLEHRQDARLSIEFQDNRNPKDSSRVVFDDEQCSIVTRQLCETTDELHEVLSDFLSNSTSNENVRLIDDRRLEVSIPISFGSRNRKKLWSFVIEFPLLEPTELTLDPSDWTETRRLGHRVMDDMIDYLRDVRLRSTWRPMPSEVKRTFQQTDLPLKGESPWKVYEEVSSLVLPYPAGNIHPRFWGYVKGTGSIVGTLAELITATMNPNAWGGNQASIYLERQVLLWLKMIMGFPGDETSSGILVSGSSVATIMAMVIARRKFNGRKIKVYYSTEAHGCVARAINVLGIGKENAIVIKTNAQRQIDLTALEAALDPSCCGVIIGSAGTVGTGAIDDLNGLADLCARRAGDLWFHVDGAIGAVACCSKRLQPLFAGLERADSLAFDLHKWLFVPYECGCLLVRDGQLHRSSFASAPASYMTLLDGGIAPSEGETFFSDYGFELSRSMKSLKVWMTFKTYGLETFAGILEQNVDQAQYFAARLREHENELELLATGPLSIVCFRYLSADRGNLNELNKRILVEIQERGVAIVSPLVLDGQNFALRMCITNHRTKRVDLDAFLQQLIGIGRATAALLVY